MKKDEHNCEIYHFDLYGTRKEKYAFLQNNSLQTVEWQQLNPQAPNYFFVPKDFSLQEEYEKGFKIDELMKKNACGIVSSRDSLLIKNTKEELEQVKKDFQNLSEEEFRKKYDISDSRDWTYKGAKEDIKKADIVRITYRPFDNQFVLYTPKSKGVLSYPRYEIMRHLLYEYKSKDENIALDVCKYQSTFDFQHVWVTNNITDKCTVSAQGSEAGFVFPLYLYPAEGSLETERRVNMDEKIMQRIAEIIEVGNASERCKENNSTQRLEALATNIFDYIYGILHSPTYRERYKEFLKIDFPRIPYPKDKTDFEHFRKFGEQLRHIHLMEPDALAELEKQYPTLATYDQQGNNIVEQIIYNSDDDTSGVQINDTQFFANVPSEAWEFYIGGYQPAQKWLKDRKNRVLSFDDIAHYRHIIMILVETNRIMQQIQ